MKLYPTVQIDRKLVQKARRAIQRRARIQEKYESDCRALRLEIGECLLSLHKSGLTRDEIGNLIDMTSPSVSKYMNATGQKWKRGESE